MSAPTIAHNTEELLRSTRPDWAEDSFFDGKFREMFWVVTLWRSHDGDREVSYSRTDTLDQDGNLKVGTPGLTWIGLPTEAEYADFFQGMRALMDLGRELGRAEGGAHR